MSSGANLFTSLPVLAITCGDPQGVGPEVLARALAEVERGSFACLLVGPAGLLLGGLDAHGIKASEVEVLSSGLPSSWRPGGLYLMDRGQWHPKEAAGLEPHCAAAGQVAFESLSLACELALAGKVQAIVTAPVSKQAVVKAGFPFQGHTEFLAHRANVRKFAMVFVGPGCHVALVTRHVPLKKISLVLTAERIYTTAVLLAQWLIQFRGLSQPRLALLGVNPHLGEGGLLGEEEQRVIAPARERLKEEGWDVAGPLATEVAFTRMFTGQLDGIVAMYHDQGLVPVKMRQDLVLVNVTLGLPFVRTSVSHGTAFDIAGTGRADHRSMKAAIELARQMVMGY